MIRLNDIVDQVLSYHPEADISLIEKAYVFSGKAHAGQVRLSGEPYLMHPLETITLKTGKRFVPPNRSLHLQMGSPIQLSKYSMMLISFHKAGQDLEPRQTHIASKMWQ